MDRSLDWQVRVQLFFSRYITQARPHAFVYRLTGGRVGARMPSVKPGVLLLTVRGRKTGKPHTTPLSHFQIGQQTVVAASNSGKDRHPTWYWNLRSNPDAVIQVGRSRSPVHARVADGPERERLWSEITKMHPLFAAYERGTTREIPVVVLDPVPDSVPDDTARHRAAVG